MAAGFAGTPHSQNHPDSESSTSSHAVNTALSLSSANSNAMPNFGGTFSNPPTQAEVQALADAFNGLVNALRR